MIGPFPNPITGQSLANEIIFQGLKNISEIDYLDTNFYKILTDKTKQGKFDYKKIVIVIKKIYSELKIIKLGKYDVVYMTPGGTYLGFLRFAHYILFSFFKRKTIYLHIHNGCFRNMYESQNLINKKIIRLLLNKINGIIVLGESLKFMFKDLIIEDKIFVCENGVQEEIIATIKEISEKKERYKTDNKKRVLYLSNLMEEKGILNLLKISERFTEHEIEFNLAGAIEPAIKKRVEGYLERYPQKIKYHGVVTGEKKKKLFLENYIFILPTYYSNEGQPISILEAYVTGCAVITDESVGGIKDIFKSNRNGISIKSKNLENIFDTIKNIDESLFFQYNYEQAIRKNTKFSFMERIKKILWEEKNTI